ncbi:MAG TPA: endolytic transglycosylase MltG, partial [Bacteroidales bacterium]
MKNIKQQLQDTWEIFLSVFNSAKQNFARYRQAKGLLLLIIVVCILIALGLGLAFSQNTASRDDEVIVRVERGMTGDQIGQMMYDKGLFPSLTVFHIYARIYGLENSLQAGEYVFTKDMPIGRMVTMMSQGQTASRQFTIPEGYTIDQIAQLIEKIQVGNAQAFKELAKNYGPYDYMIPNVNAVYRAEGFLFPSTYQVPRQVTEKQLIDMMAEQFQQRFTPQMSLRAAEEGLSVREVIILASLVEKEAQKATDRPVIAGVFLNRMKQSMPLQSCAT